MWLHKKEKRKGERENSQRESDIPEEYTRDELTKGEDICEETKQNTTRRKSRKGDSGIPYFVADEGCLAGNQSRYCGTYGKANEEYECVSV